MDPTTWLLGSGISKDQIVDLGRKLDIDLAKRRYKEEWRDAILALDLSFEELLEMLPGAALGRALEYLGLPASGTVATRRQRLIDAREEWDDLMHRLSEDEDEEWDDEDEEWDEDEDDDTDADDLQPAHGSDDLVDLFGEAPDGEFRGRAYALPRQDASADDPQPLLKHQIEALDAIHENGWASGIIHLPTGSGKTRIALEMAARLLRADPETRIIWATGGKALIRQSMVRVVERAAYFPPDLAVAWLRSANTAQSDLFDAVGFSFVTRRTLTDWLDREAGEQRGTGPLKRALTSRGRDAHPIVLFYDECHELGASALQRAWRKFDARVIKGNRQATERFRVYGLSATPMPTEPGSHRLLQKVVFPVVPDTHTAKPEWNVLVHHSESMRRLTEQHILCPINSTFQDSGAFEISEPLFRRATGRNLTTRRKPKRGQSRKQWANEFARDFNREVMGDSEILSFLSDRIAAHLPQLGKTMVFSPTIAAANELVANLSEDERVGSGNVTLVHSRMQDPEVMEIDTDDEWDRDAMRPETQIAAFVARREPCVIVNVGMLTTGFDDPKVQTIVLARLTFSRNLFWQMLGRGLRGPVAGGTPDCYVIDPIRLTDAFAVLEGYRPEVQQGGRAREEFSKSQRSEEELDALTPTVISQLPPPGPDPEMVGIARTVRDALLAFLHGEPVEPRELLDIVEQISLRTDQDGVVRIHPALPAEAAPDRTEAPDAPATVDTVRQIGLRAILRQHVISLAQKLDCDLDWFETLVPNPFVARDEPVVLRKLQRIGENEIRTLEAWREYEYATL